MRFRSIASVGVFLSALCVGSFVFAAPFTDIANSPYRGAIERLGADGIINGYADSTFRPQEPINRAELLKILVGSNGVQLSAGGYHDCFSDVKTEWFAPYICYAKEKQWIQGYADGSFKPGQTVNMAEAIKMIIQSYEYRPNQTSSSSSYSDVDPSAWYAPYVNIAKQMGVIDASDGTLGVGNLMTRGAISGMIYRGMMARKQADTPHAVANLIRRVAHPSGGSNTTPIISFADITKTYGDASFTIAALSNSLGHIIYTSDNENVARINGSTVTIVGAGSATITATQEANGRFSAGSATMSLQVNGMAPTITFADLTKSHIDANFTLSPTSNSPGAFSFISSNSSLVSISGNTADIVGTHGIMTVTANQAASGNFAAASKTMTLTVYITYCIAEPCINGGTCIPQFSGNLTADTDNMRCECPDHYSGVNCESSDINCYENGGDLICNNGGTCEASEDNGTCNCINGFCGTYCQILPSQCNNE